MLRLRSNYKETRRAKDYGDNIAGSTVRNVNANGTNHGCEERVFTYAELRAKLIHVLVDVTNF
jgi:hypothetical protein